MAGWWCFHSIGIQFSITHSTKVRHVASLLRRFMPHWVVITLVKAQTLWRLPRRSRQAGEIFGGGAKASSRHEDGKTKPPLALVKLQKVLDRNPGLLDEIRSP
jgi:hypothetical protein